MLARVSILQAFWALLCFNFVALASAACSDEDEALYDAPPQVVSTTPATR